MVYADMKVLIIGGSGMLGHRLLGVLRESHTVKATIRDGREACGRFGLFDDRGTYFDIDGSDSAALTNVLADFRPAVVVNAAGMVKQRRSSTLDALEANVMLPHRLAELCRSSGAKLIHMSTDCVFSGGRGRYREDDRPDPQDDYGRMKLLGEVTGVPHLTLRVSMIGIELVRRLGLLEWYLAQRGDVSGYTKAVFSALTTQELARVIDRIISRHLDIDGVWHVGAAPVSKFWVLERLTRYLDRRDIRLVPDESVVCDRSLDGSRFEQRTGYRAPAWDGMLLELAADIRAHGRLQ